MQSHLRGPMNGGTLADYSHPATLYQAPKIPNFSFFTERKRLSGPSLRRFFKIMEKWKAGPIDAQLLLGGITSQRFKQLSSRPEGRILKQDQLLRVTSVIAIYQSLHKLLSRKQADKWVQTPHGLWIFHGRTPLSYMVDGGILSLWELRLLLEARVSGSSETER